MDRKCLYCGGQIEYGGIVRIVMRKDKDSAEAHPGCADAAAAPPQMGDGPALSKFTPFSTTNMSARGEKIEVKSLRHLRQLENHHGVQSAPYNSDGY